MEKRTSQCTPEPVGTGYSPHFPPDPEALLLPCDTGFGPPTAASTI